MPKVTKKITIEDVERTTGGVAIKTHIKAGPNRRKHDHIGQFNFKVEIEGVTVGAFK